MLDDCSIIISLISHFFCCCFQSNQMLVGLQFHINLLDLGGTSPCCFTPEFHISIEHNPGASGEITPEPYQRYWASEKSGSGCYRADTITWHHKYIKYDWSTPTSDCNWVCLVVLYNSLSHLIPRLIHCHHLLLSE